MSVVFTRGNSELFYSMNKALLQVGYKRTKGTDNLLSHSTRVTSALHGILPGTCYLFPRKENLLLTELKKCFCKVHLYGFSSWSSGLAQGVQWAERPTDRPVITSNQKEFLAV